MPRRDQAEGIVGTRSNIYVETKPGTYLGTYCHFDGYPSYMLPILKDMTNDKLTGCILTAIPRGGFRVLDERLDKIDYLNDNFICILTDPCEEDMGPDFVYIKQFNGSIKYRCTYPYEDWTYDSEDTNESR